MESYVPQGLICNRQVVSANCPLNTQSGLFVTRPKPGLTQHFAATTDRPFSSPVVGEHPERASERGIFDAAPEANPAVVSRTGHGFIIGNPGGMDVDAIRR